MKEISARGMVVMEGALRPSPPRAVGSCARSDAKGCVSRVCKSELARWARKVVLETRMVSRKGEDQGYSLWSGDGTNGAFKKKSAERRWVMLGWAQALKRRNFVW